MAMEPLGGSMPAGQPVAVSAGNRSHAFAIAAGGAMNHWISRDGGPWSGPTPLLGGNLVASVPCAIALPNGTVHVFAITAGGPISHWSSTDGNVWAYQVDPRVPIPGGWNGLAVASMDGQRIDVFATTASGIIQCPYNGNQALPFSVLPDSGGLPTRLLAAVSSAPGKLDVFAVEPRIGMVLHWHFDGSWSKQLIPGALHVNSGLAAVTTAPGQVELFGITPNAQMASWSITGKTFIPKAIPPGPWPLPEGVPAVVASSGRLDLFAIGKGGVLQGGPLVHWRREGGTTKWSNPIAYDSGLAAGGVTAIKGASGLEAFGFQSGSNNCLLHWPAGIGATDHDPWRNWANNRQTNPQGHCRAQCLEELVAIVKSATRQDKRVRAVGSSWSFSDIAVTPGYVVETSKLSSILDTVLPQALVDNPNPNPAVPAHFIHVEAGIQLENLMTWLDGKGMAPATMGGAAGQTLAGVISTSVHGSHFRLPPFPDWVRAIHLVGPDGKQYWIEPKNRPITNDSKLRQALGSEVEVKRDDDWFDSALVAVGSLGIVYSVILEVRSAYKLLEKRTRVKWSALKPRFVSGKVFTDDAPDGVQVAIDPGSMGGSDPDCYLTVRHTAAMSLASTPQDRSFDPQAAFCESDILETLYRIGSPVVFGTLLGILGAIPGVAPVLAAMMPVLGPIILTDAAVPILYNVLKAGGPGAVGDFIGMVLDKHPQLTSLLISEITKSAQKPGQAVDLAHQIMAPRNKGECIARGLALEVAIDTKGGAHLAFVDAAIALLKDEATKGRFLGGWFSLRFVGKSRAILSPQRTARTCMIEFVGLRTLSSTKPLLARLEELGRKHKAIQHWGMFDVDMTGKSLTAADVARAYPRLNTWRRVRWELTNGGTVHTFDNAFMTRCGLTDPPKLTVPWESLAGVFTSGPAVCSWAPGRLDVFARGTDNALWHKWRDGGNWSGWEQLGTNPFSSDPAAVSWGPNRIDVFVRGTDNALYTKWWDGSRWSDYVGLGGTITSGPAVCSWAPGRLDVFARGTDNALWHKWWDGSQWSGWEQLGTNPFSSDPAAVSRGPNLIDVFVRGTDNALYRKSWDGSRWSGYVGLGGVFTSGPAACSWGPNRLDLFGRGTDNALYTESWNGAGWSGWHRVAPEPISSDPAAVSWGSNHIDVVVRGSDNQMWTRPSDGLDL